MSFRPDTRMPPPAPPSVITTRRKRGGPEIVTRLSLAALLVPLSACINVRAPEAPIVIELNINIRQEVIYRLAEDAANTIDENADIF